MDIAILGNGMVGGALAEAWTRAGHIVHLGVRNPDDVEAVGEGSVGTLAEVVAGAEVVVVALPWGVTREVLPTLPLDGKIVVDCTLPIVRNEQGMALEVGHESSGAELLQAAIPKAHLVKTLGQVGFEAMRDASRLASTPVMLVAADDGDARMTVVELVTDLGFEGVDVGALAVSRLLEPYGMLWIHLAFRAGVGRDFAFALSRP